MGKELKISLKDKNESLWGVNEIQYRLLMARHNVTEDTIPHLDESSTKEERDYVFGELLKEYKNVMDQVKDRIRQLGVEQVDAQGLARAFTKIVIIITLLVVLAMIFWGG